MIKDFLKKITEWILEKEEEAAKNCAIPIEEIEKQLNLLIEKRKELQKKCEEDLKEIDELIEKIKNIKAKEMLKCSN